MVFWFLFLLGKRRHTTCALVMVVQTCALPITLAGESDRRSIRWPSPLRLYPDRGTGDSPGQSWKAEELGNMQPGRGFTAVDAAQADGLACLWIRSGDALRAQHNRADAAAKDGSSEHIGRASCGERGSQ